MAICYSMQAGLIRKERTSGFVPNVTMHIYGCTGVAPCISTIHHLSSKTTTVSLWQLGSIALRAKWSNWPILLWKWSFGEMKYSELNEVQLLASSDNYFHDRMLFGKLIQLAILWKIKYIVFLPWCGTALKCIPSPFPRLRYKRETATWENVRQNDRQTARYKLTA